MPAFRVNDQILGDVWGLNVKGTAGVRVSGTVDTQEQKLDLSVYGNGSAGLPNWTLKLKTDAANAKLVLLGDSTSYEPNAATLYSRLRSFHTAAGQGLAGMTADASHIINGGNNGLTLAGWLANSGGTYTFANLVTDAPDLIVFSFGINDVRQGATTQAQLVRLIKTAVNQILAALPASDIILRVPNSFTTDNVTSLNFVTDAAGTVNPAGAAQTYTDLLRNAYYQCGGVWPNVVIWDSQTRVFGRKSIASTSSNLFANQIHPSATGYTLISDTLVGDLIGQKTTYGLPLGDGIATTTFTPYTVDPAALDDTSHYQIVYAGEYNAQAATTLTIGTSANRVDEPVGYPLDVQNGDVVRLPDETVYKLVGASILAQNSGGPIPNLLLSGQTIPANTATGGRVRIYRELDQADTLLAKIRSSVGANRFVRVGRITGGGTNFATIQREPDTASTPHSGQWPVRPTDSIYIAGGGANPVSLAAYTFTLSGNHLQLATGTTFDFTNFVGRLAVIVGAHAGETTGDHLQTQSVVAGTIAATSTADFTVTYTGARFGKPYTAVVAQPQASVAAGVTWTAFTSAADTVTLRFCNPTASGVVVGTLNWDFWLIR